MPSLCSCKTSASVSLRCGEAQPQEKCLLVSGGKMLQCVTSIHLIYNVLEKKSKQTNPKPASKVVNSFKYRKYKFIVLNSKIKK